MEVFPVVVAEEEDAIYVGVKDGSLGPGFVSQSFKGGSDTSLENNNVFASSENVRRMDRYWRMRARVDQQS